MSAAVPARRWFRRCPIPQRPHRHRPLPVHEDLRRSVAVRAVMDALVAVVASGRALLED
ncbi:hypothetical protein [Azospirillum picis]|uniref:Uncharacterized protein n=1 Tax=Azospirillum picis TaxID=488438 RepID=A0ABU0ME57_9PROT|nr:hypothetical protein [Azospirillum picis]MBP2297882.1 hypothetical protein [Azospirillum picis]MDQ0531720.1 hypothetical protein [Azospirillum picis]